MKTFLQFLVEKKFINTSTANKMAIVGNENDFIKNFVPQREKNEQIVGVVGDAKTGLVRHIAQYTDLGFSPKNAFIFEILHQEYKNLLYHNSLLSHKVNILKGDIFKPRMLAKRPKFDINLVTHADIDITTILPANLTGEIENIFKLYPNLKSAVFVHSLRNTSLRSNELTDFISRPEIQKFFNLVRARFNTVADPLISSFKNVLEVYLTGTTGRHKILTGLDKDLPNDSILIQNYQGAGPMVSITVVKETDNRVFEYDVPIISTRDYTAFNQLKNSVLRWPSFNSFYMYASVNEKPYVIFNEAEYKKLKSLLTELGKFVTSQNTR